MNEAAFMLVNHMSAHNESMSGSGNFFEASGELAPTDSGAEDEDTIVYIGGVVLLFVLMGSMSASVNLEKFKACFKNPTPLLIGLGCQFILLPLFGYMCVKLFATDDVTSISLLIMTIVPGGAFANWFCSLFNADLPLSLALTTTSILLSLAIMPVNIFLFISTLYGGDVTIAWMKLFVSIASACAGLISGLFVSHSRPNWRKQCSIAGTVAGIVLMVYGAITSSTHEPIWDRCANFYPQVGIPCVLGMLVPFLVSKAIGIPGPQSCAVATSCAYQNTGISMSIIFATFSSDDQGAALGVPMYYGIVQPIVAAVFNLIMWKLDFTYCSSKTTLLEMLKGNYQPTDEDYTEVNDDDDDDDVDVENPASSCGDVN
eukprot:TRINITY_DN1564_c1_g1_i1.p1 TRINITY_DN1564_c1_g1~~TRINITY_DN1564_c1_g1_i1.p1  ORF type:complete len:390 (+),score=62.35 TRINITY_DN1564_c1_g1_i1:52-1170(+)